MQLRQLHPTVAECRGAAWGGGARGHATQLVEVAGRLMLHQEAAVAELAMQEARYAAMLTVLQETVGRAMTETDASAAAARAGSGAPV